MRKLTITILACSALAMALPAAAQPNDYGPARGPGYDQRQGGYDRGDYRASDLNAQYDRLYAQVDRDYRSGRMGKNQAKNFFKRINELKGAIEKAEAKHRGHLDDVEFRNQTRALNDLRQQYDQFQRESRGRRY